MTIMTQVIEILVGGISGVATGVGAGLSTLATSIFLTSGIDTGYELSVMGTLIVVFAGISLALGLNKAPYTSDCIMQIA